MAPIATAAPAYAADPTCFGETPTITGTEDGETLHGTPGDDVIVGLGGDDIISAGKGEDLICGAADVGSSDSANTQANDQLDGQSGDDKLKGTESPSSISGGWATGGKGDDRIESIGATYVEAPRGISADFEEGTATGWGKDTLVGVTRLLGSSHDDLIYGENQPVQDSECGCDEINGRGGDDEIHGLRGWDRIRGGAGDDKLYGAKGNDYLSPGKGKDLVNGGRGKTDNDRVSYFSDNAAVFIDLREGIATGRGHDTLKHIESGVGTRFQDELWGDGDPNDLAGAAGRDELHGRKGRDRLFGDEGRDKLFGGKGHDLGIGGSGTDTCHTEGTRSCES